MRRKFVNWIATARVVAEVTAPPQGASVVFWCPRRFLCFPRRANAHAVWSRRANQAGSPSSPASVGAAGAFDGGVAGFGGIASGRASTLAGETGRGIGIGAATN